jgi:photoactive yellow protein
MTQSKTSDIKYDDSALFDALVSLTDTEMDALSFGVIGFDSDEIICTYNAPEAKWAGLDKDQILGSPMFEVVAPCMNNYLIAERFNEARVQFESLDVTLDYVLTLRMRPTPCTLRLLADPVSRIRFILISRK